MEGKCERCGKEVDNLHRVTVAGKRLVVCDSCFDELYESNSIERVGSRKMRKKSALVDEFDPTGQFVLCPYTDQYQSISFCLDCPYFGGFYTKGGQKVKNFSGHRFDEKFIEYVECEFE